MKVIKYIFSLAILFFWNSHITGQDSLEVNTKANLEAIFKIKNGNIHLRWAPNTPGLWLKSQRGSYIVMRQSWGKESNSVDAPLVQISDTLRVWSGTAFDQLSEVEKENEYLMLAGYCMHAPYESIRDTKLTLESIVDREEELTNRFSSALFAAERSKEAAEAMALSFVDRDIDLTKNHVYHILLITEEKKIYQTRVHYLPNINYSFKPNISKFSEEEQMIVLSWDKSSHKKHYSSYWIERSTDNIIFERLNAAPYVHAFDASLPAADDDFIYMDSVENYTSYYYRIIGMDAFGDESEPSESVKLMGRDKTPPKTISSGKAEMHLDQYMQVSWIHEAENYDLEGFYIKKSRLREGPFTSYSPLLPKSSTSFKDSNPDYIGSNFYQVCAVDTAKNEACSYPIYGLLRDTIPPKKPVGLMGNIDSSGIVTLSWEAGNELDLKGYNVYFANKWNRVFSVLNSKPVYTNTYQDTINLNTLTEDIYYKIVAIDVRDNLSEFSDMVQLFKPDTIPPGPSVFKTFKANNGEIRLSWAPSSSKDVVEQLLYRSSDGGEFSVVQHFDKLESEFIDRELKPNTLYSYRIIAVDDSGLMSESIKDISIKSPVNLKLEGPTLEITETDGIYTLKCSLETKNESDGKWIIYAKQGTGPFVTRNTIKTSDGSIEIPISSDNQTQYKARFIQVSGYKSDYSNIVSLMP